jgi:DNA repair ATPase RecN
MPDGPTGAVPQILIKIQDSISTLRSEVGQFRTSVEGRLDRLEGRLDRLELLSRKYRRDAAAMMVIMRATVGHFNERVGAVEDRVTALEIPKS